jgi:hypothetical protein
MTTISEHTFYNPQCNFIYFITIEYYGEEKKMLHSASAAKKRASYATLDAGGMQAIEERVRRGRPLSAPKFGDFARTGIRHKSSRRKIDMMSGENNIGINMTQ